jgi:hypothetical protein
MSSDGTQVGQRVTVDATKHRMPLDLLNATLEIASITGRSSDFVTLRGPRGVLTHFGKPEFFRADELLPARAKIDSDVLPRVVEREQSMQMSMADEVLNLANTYVTKFGLTAAEAAKKAGRELLTTEDKKAAYRGVDVAREPVRSLSSRSSANEVRAELERVTRERGCTAAEAADVIVANAGASRFAERVVQLRRDGLDAVAALVAAQREDPKGAEAWREAGVN